MSDARTGWTGDLTDCLSKIWRERLSARDDPSSVAGALADIATPVDLKTQLLSELIRGRRAADGEGRALRVVLSLLLGTRVFSASRVLYEMPEALAVIEAELAPSPFWIEHIRSLARSAVEADLAEAMTGSAILSSMIGSAWLEAEADQIRLPLCEPISFDRLFEVLSPDGIAPDASAEPRAIGRSVR